MPDVSETINARSSPLALIPHETPAARNPLGAVTLPSIDRAEHAGHAGTACRQLGKHRTGSS